MSKSFRVFNAYLLSITLLLGIFFSRDSNIICISSDGNLEVETVCLPDCEEVVVCCEFDVESEKEKHDHNDGCSDIDIDRSFLANRSINGYNEYNFDNYLVFSTNSISAKFSSFSINFSSKKYHIPPPDYLSTTVLRC